MEKHLLGQDLASDEDDEDYVPDEGKYFFFIESEEVVQINK